MHEVSLPTPPDAGTVSAREPEIAQLLERYRLEAVYFKGWSTEEAVARLAGVNRRYHAL